MSGPDRSSMSVPWVSTSSRPGGGSGVSSVSSHLLLNLHLFPTESPPLRISSEINSTRNLPFSNGPSVQSLPVRSVTLVVYVVSVLHPLGKSLDVH